MTPVRFVVLSMSVFAVAPFDRLRTARITRAALWEPYLRAASRPRPVLEPVIIIVLFAICWVGSIVSRAGAEYLLRMRAAMFVMMLYCLLVVVGREYCCKV